MKLNIVGIIARLDSSEAIRAAKKITYSLLERNVKPILEEKLAEEIGWKGEARSIEKMDVDLVIVIGGDGTVLRTARLLSKLKTPILAVNAGTLGFLSEVDVDGLNEAIDLLMKNAYTVEQCSRIKAVINGEEMGDALNEITIITEEPVKVLNLIVKKNDETIFSGRADGLIIATKTGSTAYALSAGGPIIDPELDVFVIVLLCPLKIYQRPLVIPSTARLSILIAEDGSNALVVADGQVRRKASIGSVVTIEKSGNKSYFIRFGKSFYKRLRERMIKDV